MSRNADKNLFEFIGAQIRELRNGYNNNVGISQEALAESLNVAANTVSRWETAAYHPGIDDLLKLSEFFGVPVVRFLPDVKDIPTGEIAGLLRIVNLLDDDDLAEVKAYAEFRLARARKRGRPRLKKGKK